MKEKKPSKSFRNFVNAQERQLLNENYEKFVVKFRRYYRTGQLLTFREWINIVGDLLDTLV